MRLQSCCKARCRLWWHLCSSRQSCSSRSTLLLDLLLLLLLFFICQVLCKHIKQRSNMAGTSSKQLLLLWLLALAAFALLRY